MNLFKVIENGEKVVVEFKIKFKEVKNVDKDLKILSKLEFKKLKYNFKYMCFIVYKIFKIYVDEIYVKYNFEVVMKDDNEYKSVNLLEV